MDKRLKRFLSLALAVMMVISLMPSNAFATSTTVAKIGTEEYTDLQAALNAGGEIVLQADVALTAGLTVAADKAVVLDLNGKTVSMEDASGATSALLKNNGTLTIQDSVGSGKLTFKTTTPSAENAYASNTISNYGVLTVAGGLIENTSVGGACYALDNYAGSTATISGGKLTAVKTAVRIFDWTNNAGTELNVTGGEILSEDGYGINLNMGNTPTVALNISGGTITTNDTDYNLAVYVVSKNSAENVTIDVTDGTFNGNFALNGTTCTTMKEDAISISGGNFEAGVICWGEPAYGIISGGTFAQAPAEELMAPGYVLGEDGQVKATLPEAEVVRLYDVEINEYTVYDALGSGNSDATTVLKPQITMQFTAQDSAEEAAKHPYADYITDFFINIDGLASDSFVADNCYLVGHYGSYGWWKIPLDNFNVQNNTTYPVISAFTNGAFDYETICSDVVTFKCGIYIDPAILEANPGLNVDLILGLSETYEDAVAAQPVFEEVSAYDYTADQLKGNVAKIGQTIYQSLEEAFAAAVEGDTIILLDDAAPALTSQSAITKAAVIDLNGYTLTLTEDDLYFGTTTFKNGEIVVDPSVKPSTAVFWMFKEQTLTFDAVKLTATGVTGTYLIGLDGNNADLNLLNGSEIFIDNETALDLDVICVNASTGNDILVEDSKVTVTNLDGRVFFRGNYTISGDSVVSLEGITKAGFRIEAGQTLSVEDTASVTIVGEPRDGGIHLTDLTATYTKADTATVSATLNAPVAVAMIGSKKYTDLQTALDEVQNGQTIELLADVESPASAPVKIQQKQGISFTLKGNDNTITGVIWIQGYAHKSSETLTIQNVNFQAVEGNDACILSPDRSKTGVYSYSHNVTVDSCDFVGVNDTTRNATAAIRMEDGGDFNWTIKKCTVDSNMHSLLQVNNVEGKLTVEGCTVNAKNGINLSQTANVEVKDSTFNVSGYAVRMGDKNGALNDTVKTLVMTGNKIKSESDDGDAAVFMRGQALNTTITMNKNSVVAPVHITASNDNTINADANYWGENVTGPVVSGAEVEIISYYTDAELTNLKLANPEAKIGNVEYVTIQDAINAAQAGDTVIVLRDVEVTDTVTVAADKVITLDLNGKTISQTKAQTTGYQMILNDGNLTIKDSVGGGKISYTDSGNGGEYISDTIYNRGTLVINGGTIENLSSATVASNGYPHAVDTYSGIRDTSVTINGGTIYCAEYSAIRMFCVSATYKADLVINGGTIKGAVDMQNGTKDAALGSLTINGGTFETTKNANNIRFANWNGGATEYGITAEIKGGSFNGGITTKYVPEAANWDSGIISGGTYTVAPEDVYLAPGYEIKYDSENRVFGVEPKVVASVNGEEFTTLEAAVEEAKNGGTIYLKGDVTLKDTLKIPAGYNVILDLKGFEINQTKACTASYSMIENEGTLTIKDSKGGGLIWFKDTGVGDPNAGWGSYTITNSGTLVVESGTIEHRGEQNQAGKDFAHTTLALFQYSGSTTINGGTISTPNYRSIRLWSGDMTINGGTMDGQVWVHCVNDTSKLTINGGNFSPNWKDGSSVFVNNSGYEAELNVTGGTFETRIGADSPNTLEGSKIVGGTFTEAAKTKTDKDLLTEDFIFSATANADGYYVIEDNPYYIADLAELKAFRDSVNAGNSYSGKKPIILGADIDLKGEEWTPIGDSTNTFQGTFDGNDKTISNLVINGGSKSNQGFFGFTTNGEIKNLTINNAKVSGYLAVGVVAGSPYTSKYTDIKVTGHVEVNGMAYVGGVGGRNAYANWTDITVDVDSTSYVKADSVEDGTAYRTYVGGVIGFNGEGGHTFKNISSNIKVIGNICDIGGIFGILHYGNNADGITFAGTVEAAEGATEVGGIAGVWHNQKGTAVTITNADSTGTVKIGDKDVTASNSIVGGAYTPSYNDATNSGTLTVNGEQIWPVAAMIGDVRYQTLADAFNAAKDGDEVKILAAGTYELSTSGRNITITGAVDGVVFDNIGAKNMGGANVTFNNVTFDYYPNTNYTGLQHSGNLVYNNCTINGQVFLYGQSETFNNCTFNQNSADAYNVWTYGAAKVAFNECTFNSVGKAVLIYTESATTFNEVTVEKSKFNASAPVEGKAAIEMDSSLSAGIKLTVDADTTATGFDNGNISGNSLWNNKKGKEGVNNDIAVTVADVVVLQPVKTAEINGLYYTTLQAAMEAAKDNETVKLLTDTTLSEIITNTKTVTLDLNGKTITGTDTTEKNFSLIDNRGTLTITDSSENKDGKITLTATVNSGWNRYSAVIANNPGGKLVVEAGTLEHLGGTDMAYGIDNLTNGKGTYAETVINGGTIKSTYRGIRQFLNGVEAQNILTINGGTIEGANKSIWMQDPNKNANTGKLTVSGNAKLNGNVYLSVTEGSTEWPVEVSIASAALTNGATVMTSNVPAGYEVVENNGIIGVESGIAKIDNVVYGTLKEAFDAAQDGDEIEILVAGTYELSTSGKNITITGAVDGVVFDNIGAKNMGGANVTFNNVTFDYYPNTNYTGLQHSGNLVYNNCTINGQVFLYGQSETFNNCTFNQNSADAYNVWTYGAAKVAFNECTFNSVGKAVLIYTESATTFNEVTVEKSEFNASAPVEGKAAIEMDSSLSAGIKLTVDAGTTATGFDNGNISGNSLWNNKKDNKTEPNNDITVTVADTTVLEPKTLVAQVGETKYTSLSAAIAAALEADGTVTLLADVTEDVTIAGNLTIEGGNFKYTGTMTVNAALTVTVQNVNFVKGGIAKSTKSTTGTYTIKNCTFDGEGSYAYPALFKGADKIVIENCTVKNYLYSFLYVTSGTNTVSVQNVTVEDCPNYAVYFASGVNSATFTDLTVKNSDNGFVINNTANRAFTIENCKMENVTTAINYSNGTNTITCTVLGGENDFGTAAGSEYVKYVLAASDATLTASADLNVTSGVDGKDVYYKDGKYYLAQSVAQIGQTKYESFEEALAAVQNGETINILENAEGSELSKELEFTKDIAFTITGKNAKYELPVITFQNATVNIENAEILIPELDARQNATINVIDSIVHDAGGDSIIKSYYNGAINISGTSVAYTMQVTTMGYITISDTAKLNATWQTNVYGNGLITVKDDATFVTAALHLTGQDYSGRDNTDEDRVGKSAAIVVDGANLIIGKVYSDDGADYSYNSSKGINIGTVDGKSAVLDIKNGASVNIYMADGETANIGAGGAVNVDASALTVACRADDGVATLNNNGSIVLKTVDAFVTANQCDNVTTDVADYKVVYENGTYKIVPMKYVAQIGTTAYESLAEAIKAAQNNETIILLQNLNIADLTPMILDNDYNSYFIVEGKTITIDLAGKTISGDYTAEDKLLVGVFSTDNKGHLTLTGNGTVDIKAAGTYPDHISNVYSLLATYEEDCSITIENGTYTLDKAHDSLIYSGENEGVIVKGGTFNLGNVGSGDNGKPWIFNVLGGNAAHVVVNGGTFNSDIAHQFWANEVYIPENKALKKEGTNWTIVDAVAYAVEIGTSTGSFDRNVGYATLDDAIASNGNSIYLLANAEQDVVIPGRTLNLNGFQLKGNVVGNLAMNGGTYITGDNYNMAAPSGDFYYLTSNATIAIEANGDIAIASGDVTLGQSWRTLDNQTVTVAEGASFTVPTGMTFQVYGTAIAEGTLTVNGTIELMDNDATLTAAANLNVITNMANCKIDYTNGKYSVVAKNGVAKIGTTVYESLAEAIKAAVDGETITLVKDINLADIEPGTLDGSYDSYFIVEGKSVTIHLAGKTISGAYTGSDMLVGVFSTDNNGHLTLTGNGTVNVTATGKVYSLIANYEAGCSITIENGTYILDKASDSLIYSGANVNDDMTEGVIVKGGTFNLGNVGSGENGKPWIFNVLDSNKRHVVVEGGTFNADVNHQYWIHEVQMPQDKALKNNGDGTWTVVPAAAFITEMHDGYEHYVGYETLAEAIAAVQDGQTITLVKDNAENVIIKQTADKSFTIDGNEKTYTGTITIDGSNRTSGAETLTIQKLNFVLETSEQNGIFAEKSTQVHNVTIDGCTFTGNDEKDVYGIRLHHSHNITVKNTSGTKLCDLVYAQTAVTGLTAENITVTDSGMGFMLPYGMNLTFKNVNLDVESYGIGIYNRNASSATFEDCTIKGYAAIRLDQKVATNAYTLTFNGTNSFTAADDGNWLEVLGTDASFKVVVNDTGLDMTKTTGLNVKVDSNVYFNTLANAIKATEAETVTYNLLAEATLAEAWAVAGNVTVEGAKLTADLTITGNMTLTSEFSGTATLADVAATLTAADTVIVVSGVADYKVVYENGVHKLVAMNYVAQVGDKKFEKLSEAIAAATAGDTVTLLADVAEDVTIDENLTIEGADKNYTGTMTVNTSLTVTISNVNFVKASLTEVSGTHCKLTVKDCDFDGNGEIGYAISVRGCDSVVIENCTATNYSYGMLYTPSSVASIFVKDVTVTNVTAAFNISYSGDGIFENVNVTNATYGLHVQNYGARTFTLKNCAFKCTSPVYVQVKGEATVTFAFEGINDFGTNGSYADLNGYGILKLAAADATLKADNGMGVISGVDNYEVVYEEGTYKLNKLNYIAQIVAADGTKIPYDTLDEAISIAKTGDTIQLLDDVSASTVMIPDGITIDLNGKTLTASYMACFGNLVDDSTDNAGVLNVDSSRFMIREDNAQLPIKTTEGYKFFVIERFPEASSTVNGTDAFYQFLPAFEAPAHEFLADGGTVGGVQVVVRVSWTVNGSTRQQDYIYSESTVAQYIANYNGTNYVLAFNLTLKNAAAYQDLEYRAYVVSDLGVEFGAQT